MYILMLLICVFTEFLSVQTCVSLRLCFLPLFFGSFSYSAVLSYPGLFVISSSYRKGMDPDGRGGRENLGGLGGEETINRIYCIKKLFSMNKKERTKRKWSWKEHPSLSGTTDLSMSCAPGTHKLGSIKPWLDEHILEHLFHYIDDFKAKSVQSNKY